MKHTSVSPTGRSATESGTLPISESLLEMMLKEDLVVINTSGKSRVLLGIGQEGKSIKELLNK